MLFSITALSQNRFEDRQIQRVDITLEGADKDVSAAEQFRLIAGEEVGDRYSTVKIRNALEKLYKTDKIISAKVEATDTANSAVALRFIIKRKSIAKKISINVRKVVGEPVTEQELMLRLNLLSPGTAISDKVLGR